MSKGFGTGASGGGSRMTAGDRARRTLFQRNGLRGQSVSQIGLRPESFAHLRAGGAVHGGVPQIRVSTDGKATVLDGRHRITVARERGESTIVARVFGEGPRGGTRWSYTGRIKI